MNIKGVLGIEPRVLPMPGKQHYQHTELQSLELFLNFNFRLFVASIERDNWFLCIGIIYYVFIQLCILFHSNRFFQCIENFYICSIVFYGYIVFFFPFGCLTCIFLALFTGWNILEQVEVRMDSGY